MEKKTKRHLLLEHLDNKMSQFASVPDKPLRGWVNAIRSALRMSYRQLGIQLGISAQQTRRIELQEQDGSMTLAALHELASSLNLRFVYGFTPKDGTLVDMLDKQAQSVADKLIKGATVALLDNQSDEQVEEATRALVEKIKTDIPRNLWNLHK